VKTRQFSPSFCDHRMGGTRIFELGGSEGQGGGHRAKENYCYRTFNWGKL